MSRKKNYKKIPGVSAIWQHIGTKKYYAEKKIKRKTHSATFNSLYEAKVWRKDFDGISYTPEDEKISQHSTLKQVWQKMQEIHFPLLATSTKTIWKRRYRLWENIEHLPMDKITPSKVTKWISYWVEKFKDEEYQRKRGKAGRCNLNNELNIFVTIFNWYKESEEFEKEALYLTCPIKKKHKKLGFIKPVPVKKKQIDLEHAFLFFNFLRPLYRDLAKLQFFAAARISEIAGLQWECVDFENRRMLIKFTSIFGGSSKMFQELKPFPKNREPRVVYITDEILEILKRMEAFKRDNCGFVFHVEGKPLNYGTIQVNYRGAQRKSGIPYTGTHILRHGMAKLARKVGGGLDAVVAMTGHKDIKLADHYSKCDETDQKEISQKVMEHISEQLKRSPVTPKKSERKKLKQVQKETHEHSENSQAEGNVVSFEEFKRHRVC